MRMSSKLPRCRMISQRCQNGTCRNYFPPSKKSCTHCGQPVPRGLRFLVCKKKIHGKLHFLSLGQVTMEQAEKRHAAWLQEIMGPPATIDSTTLREMA